MQRLSIKTITSLLTTTLIIGTLTAVALADQPLLHEFFVIPLDDLPSSPTNRASALETPPEDDDPATRTALSDALQDNDPSKTTPPPLTVENQGDELELSSNNPPITPEGQPAPSHNGPLNAPDQALPDRETTLDHDLNYFSVFNPSVVPWKRTGSRDLVGANFGLRTRNRNLYPVQVRETQVREDHQRFWGSILVRMEPGKPIPLPSVAPHASIVRYQTEPPTYLRFQRDLADNYYVSSQTDRNVRINYLMEAPNSYFGGDISPSIRVSDLPTNLRPKLPPNVQRAANRVIEHIGINTQAPMRDQLSALVEYFRSFTAEEFPDSEKSQNIYLDLALSKRGVCRHRAFAFVVTAHALGIMARYVYNEAHAFVEVNVPKRGWLRIDLGGAAVNFQVRNSDDKILHTPPEPDRLPQPPNFTQSYSNRLGQGQPEADIDGDGEQETIEGTPEYSTDPASSLLGPQDNPQPPPDEDDATSAFDPENITAASPDFEGAQPTPSPSPQLAFPATNTPNSPRTTQTPTQLRLLEASQQAYRGEPISIRARLTNSNASSNAQKPIRAYLVLKGSERDPDAFILVGQGNTNANGVVRLQANIPQNLPLGLWSLYLHFPGDNTLLESHSQ